MRFLLLALLVVGCTPAPDASSPPPMADTAPPLPATTVDAPIANPSEPAQMPTPTVTSDQAADNGEDATVDSYVSPWRQEWELKLSRLPPEAAAIADRAEECYHFGGEIAGDGSELDKERFARMDALRCDTIEAEVAAARKRWHDNREVLAVLDEAEGN